jgi:peptidyl-prolyl cis-trans isomerase A (cyclophilin A)/peptidyl-prolyl cis-trans isomerase B (cyclophilin B)
MIQGGGFDAGYKQKPTRAPVQNEAKNGLKNEPGTVAMARTSDPHSASAQFFINVKNNEFLNADKAQDGWGYAVFGKVVSGMDVVTKIAKTPTGAGGPFRSDVPKQPVIIESMTVVGGKK